jgi:hypothetical protein
MQNVATIVSGALNENIILRVDLGKGAGVWKDLIAKG